MILVLKEPEVYEQTTLQQQQVDLESEGDTCPDDMYNEDICLFLGANETEGIIVGVAKFLYCTRSIPDDSLI